MKRVKVEVKRKILSKEMGSGGVFDFETIRGTLRLMVFVSVGTFIMWHFYNILFWMSSVFGFEPTIPSEAERRVKRFWALVMFGTMLFSGLGNILRLYFYRRRSIKSSHGQWYDRPGLTKEELYEDEDEVSSGK